MNVHTLYAFTTYLIFLIFLGYWFICKFFQIVIYLQKLSILTENNLHILNGPVQLKTCLIYISFCI